MDADRRRIGSRIAQIMLATFWPIALLFVVLCGQVLAEPFDDQHVAVLVFTKTAGFRHDSIPDGIAAIQTLGRENGFAVEATEDAGRFTDEGLAAYRAVIFLNTTGDVLAADQERAFERYIRSGGGFVGIHSAADTEYDWAWYGDLVGAYFDSHPAIQQAQIHVADRVIRPPAFVRALGATRRVVQLPPQSPWTSSRLGTVDEGSYNGGNHGFDHPIAWCHGLRRWPLLVHRRRPHPRKLRRASVHAAYPWRYRVRHWSDCSRLRGHVGYQFCKGRPRQRG